MSLTPSTYIFPFYHLSYTFITKKKPLYLRNYLKTPSQPSENTILHYPPTIFPFPNHHREWITPPLQHRNTEYEKNICTRINTQLWTCTHENVNRRSLIVQTSQSRSGWLVMSVHYVGGPSRACAPLGAEGGYPTPEMDGLPSGPPRPV